MRSVERILSELTEHVRWQARRIADLESQIEDLESQIEVDA